jgi:hypothetical protein
MVELKLKARIGCFEPAREAFHVLFLVFSFGLRNQSKSF